MSATRNGCDAMMDSFQEMFVGMADILFNWILAPGLALGSILGGQPLPDYTQQVGDFFAFLRPLCAIAGG